MAKLEAALQTEIRDYLTGLGWLVEVITCGPFMRGIPDLYCFRPSKSGRGEGLHRWVDVKRPKGGTLTKYQAQKWPDWEKLDLGVWIMTAPGQESILFEPPNFRDWWKPRYDRYASKPGWKILEELDNE